MAYSGIDRSVHEITRGTLQMREMAKRRRPVHETAWIDQTV